MEQAHLEQVISALGMAKGEAQVRESVVKSVLAGLQAAGLSEAEKLVVVAMFQAEMMEKEGTTLMATISVLGVRQGHLVSESVAIASPAPLLVMDALQELVKMASPELWMEILRVLERGRE
jgi:hypothetical protein